jgi:hypothetical protein
MVAKEEESLESTNETGKPYLLCSAISNPYFKKLILYIN